MTQTPNFQLNQWSPEDYVRRTDFNTDNAKIDAALTAARQNAILRSEGTLMNAEHLRNGRTRNIGVQNSRAESSLMHAGGQQRSGQRFSDTALPADNSDYLADPALRIRTFQQAGFIP